MEWSGRRLQDLKAGAQELVSKEKIAEVVKELLQGCGAIPKKLAQVKLPFADPNHSVKSKPHSKAKIYPHFGQKEVSAGCSTFASATRANHPLPTRREVIKANLLKRCSSIDLSLSREGINRIICNFPSHLVAVFKEYLIYDDANEFLYRFYKEYETGSRLRRLSEYCSKREKLAPNYTVLGLGKIFYKREKRKAKIVLMRQADKLGSGSEGSSLFDTKFMNSVAKDDVENSRSRFLYTEFSKASYSDKGFSQLLAELSQIVSRKSSIRQEESKTKNNDNNEMLAYQSYPRQMHGKHFDSAEKSDLTKERTSSIHSSKISITRASKQAQSLRNRQANPSTLTTARKLRACNSLPKVKIAFAASGLAVLRNCKAAEADAERGARVRFSGGVKSQGQIRIVRASSKGVLKQ
eukprot:TRINITY_DN2196_c0_g1_i3.p1 TRINITY_DN2196_c0_g1~~TRINITY_DN2196_c0_g1_i3.p1  ORF type:complete len:409 (+),score=61.14 TRINITY_DN2196_c0_g1_i3:106-1332(+)